jgi:chromosome partitioning protein
MILSLISQKGGVGKSTIARLMGVEMARAGWKVLIADLDAAQGTSTVWKLRRDRAKIDPDLDVQKFRTVERALKETDRYDLLILDGPALAERGGVTMARRSDLVILPAGYSIDDLEPQVRVAQDLEANGVAADKIRVSLQRASGSEKEGQGVRDYLRRAGMTTFTNELREMPTIRLAQLDGRAATECTHPTLKTEALAVAKEIADTLLKGAAQ